MPRKKYPATLRASVGTQWQRPFVRLVFRHYLQRRIRSQPMFDACFSKEMVARQPHWTVSLCGEFLGADCTIAVLGLNIRCIDRFQFLEEEPYYPQGLNWSSCISKLLMDIQRDHRRTWSVDLIHGGKEAWRREHLGFEFCVIKKSCWILLREEIHRSVGKFEKRSWNWKKKVKGLNTCLRTCVVKKIALDFFSLDEMNKEKQRIGNLQDESDNGYAYVNATKNDHDSLTCTKCDF